MKMYLLKEFTNCLIAKDQRPINLKLISDLEITEQVKEMSKMKDLNEINAYLKQQKKTNKTDGIFGFSFPPVATK